MRSIKDRQGGPAHGEAKVYPRAELDKECNSYERGNITNNQKNTQGSIKGVSLAGCNNALLDSKPFFAEALGKRPCAKLISHNAAQRDKYS